MGPDIQRAQLRLPAGCSAHQAVAQAEAYVIEGYRFVVDIDLAKFFDRVNHDRLMAAVAARVADRRLLRLIRSYLTAGVLDNGLFEDSREGTPQGGPLSHWDRNRARPAVGEGFPFLLFRLQDGFTVSPWLTFPEAPL